MKRKTYEKKMRNFFHQLNQTLPAEQRLRDMRVPRPDFGYVMETGKYAGVPPRILSAVLGLHCRCI